MLLRAQRAHGNAAEYVPLVLVLLLALALVKAPAVLLHGVGGGLAAGRVLHAIGLYQSSGASVGRMLGILLTWGRCWRPPPASSSSRSRPERWPRRCPPTSPCSPSIAGAIGLAAAAALGRDALERRPPGSGRESLVATLAVAALVAALAAGAGSRLRLLAGALALAASC